MSKDNEARQSLTAREPATADVGREALETVYRRMNVLIAENEEVMTATVQKHVVAAHIAAREGIAALSRAAPSSGHAMAEGGGLEDEIAEAIDDSLDMDWTGSIGARHVMDLLRRKGIVS